MIVDDGNFWCNGVGASCSSSPICTSVEGASVGSVNLGLWFG
jgi:hypothetical protein